jgi:hypothetical protein
MATCTVVDYHDDMDPEFAPQQLEVPCTADAVYTVTYEEIDVETMTWDTAVEYVCQKHAEGLLDTGPSLGIRNVSVRLTLEEV